MALPLIFINSVSAATWWTEQVALVLNVLRRVKYAKSAIFSCRSLCPAALEAPRHVMKERCHNFRNACFNLDLSILFSLPR